MEATLLGLALALIVAIVAIAAVIEAVGTLITRHRVKACERAMGRPCAAPDHHMPDWFRRYTS